MTPEERTMTWLRSRLGDGPATDVQERVSRLYEEVTELAQAEGLTHGYLKSLLDYVFMRPIGEPFQEAGGVSVTLYGYAAAKGWTVQGAFETEIRRVEEKTPEWMRARHNAKADAGIAMRAE